jgi:4-hydroxy-3-polyprenylbenzoate decarboxylase
MAMIPEIKDMDMPIEGVFHNLVITQITKEYPGQGQKVMNAMWGAGQMMFNKILVLADEKVRIQDYLSLAKEVFRNLDPAQDITFSQGPMDVLDHSCSKLGFGGKMCIDGTRKWEEEKSDQYVYPILTHVPGLKTLQDSFPEVAGLNLQLIEWGIPCMIVAVQKNRAGHIKELHRSLAAMPQLEGLKMILYVEHTVEVSDLGQALWRFCNNLDPKRDHILFEKPLSTDTRLQTSCMGLDGTRKTKEWDGFQRDWPNIIVAAPETIRAVDEKWPGLGLGDFLPSPSLKHQNQLYGSEAVVQ